MNKIFGLLLAVVLMAVSGHSAEMATADKKAMPDEKMMAEMMKLASPGENHKVLGATVGEWNTRMKGWMSPGAKPEESTGTSTIQWIMGGRFTMENFKGTWAGQPFEGMGINGYDNMKQEYNAIWLDNMNTGMMQASSQYNPATRTLSETGSFSCPMTGEKAKWFRGELKVKDNDHFTWEMYFKDQTGKEFKSMELEYTRASAPKAK